MENQNDEYMNDFEGGTVTLELEGGASVECEILAVFPVGEKDYIALLPITDDEEGSEVYLYEYLEDEEGNPSLNNITDDEEYEAVVDAFDELMDEAEYNELLADDED